MTSPGGQAAVNGVSSLPHGASYALLRAGLNLTQLRRYRRLMEGAQRPRDVQLALLRRIMADNADTEFGRRHSFSGVADADDYRRAVPVQSYEDLRPLIERQELTGEPCLTRERPVYYHRTSGTVGAAKNIPVTPSGLGRMKGDQKLSAYVWSRDSHVLRGKGFAISGQAVEGHMEGGTPYGSASGLLYLGQSRFVRSRYVLSPQVADIEDYDLRYLVTVIFGLAEPHVTGIATANPSTFLRLLSVADRHSDTILDAIATGRLPSAESLPGPVRQALKPDPQRARYLSSCLEGAGRYTFTDIWPHLQGIVTWTGGSCGTALNSLSGLIPEGIPIIELGYLASEFRGTLNIDARHNLCLPTLFQTYFEFVEREAWESGSSGFLGLHELEQDAEYYVFVTTPDGLYRYDMNDIVRVSGRVHETPTLDFVQKGKGTTSITGEKLTESQALDAVPSILANRNVQHQFFIVIADEQTAGYTLFVESGNHGGQHLGDSNAIAAEVDLKLCELNVEYEAKRKSGRLTPLEVRWLRTGAGDQYRAVCVNSGQRDTQFKYLHLQYARECKLDFASLAQAD
ncbi:MAG: GH3 auxin-responsive promoter family protein [Chloroflexi bacterium]|nr:GH3 auxin-responsive promoter family protein [Chloroflexota bacterium]